MEPQKRCGSQLSTQSVGRRDRAMRSSITTGALLLVFLGCSATTPPSNTPWYVDGTPAQDTSAMNRSGNLAAMLFFTDQPDRLFASWETDAEGVPIFKTEQIQSGESAIAMVVFSGCAADQRGNCDLVGDFKTFNPAGSLIDQADSVDIWIDKEAPPGRQLQLSAMGASLQTGKTDIGEFRTEVILRDRNSGAHLSLSQSLQVAPD